jgi:hypothetical protein
MTPQHIIVSDEDLPDPNIYVTFSVQIEPFRPLGSLTLPMLLKYDSNIDRPIIVV